MAPKLLRWTSGWPIGTVVKFMTLECCALFLLGWSATQDPAGNVVGPAASLSDEPQPLYVCSNRSENGIAVRNAFGVQRWVVFDPSNCKLPYVLGRASRPTRRSFWLSTQWLSLTGPMTLDLNGFSWGDVTQDGICDVDDILRICEVYSHVTPLGPRDDVAPTGGGDGRIDLDDILCVLNVFAGGPCP